MDYYKIIMLLGVQCILPDHITQSHNVNKKEGKNSNHCKCVDKAMP